MGRAAYPANVLGRTRAALGWLAALAACGEDPAYAPLGEVCGVEGAVRVLELRADQRLLGHFSHDSLGDRIIYRIGERDPLEAGAYSPNSKHTSLWSVGPCGESPVQVASDVSTPFTVAQWPGAVLAYTDGLHVVSLDLSGSSPPLSAFAVPEVEGSGLVGWAERGMVGVSAIDEEFGELVFYPYPDDPRSGTVEPVPLFGPIRLATRQDPDPDAYQGGSGLIGVFPDFALVVTPEDSLVRVDLADGAATLVQPHVFAFDADLAGRYIVWQDLTSTDADPKQPRRGMVFLRDRSDSSDVFLGQASLLTQYPLQWVRDGLVQLDRRVFRLRTLEIVELPERTSLSWVIDARHWHVVARRGGAHYLFDTDTRASTVLFPDWAEAEQYEADGMRLLQVPRRNSTYRDEGPLWFAAYDGSPPRRLAARATRYSRNTADGRFLTVVDLDDAWRGALVLVDPDTEEELRVDDDVFVTFAVNSKVFGEGVVAYSVMDGDRSGVWLARPVKK